MRPNFSYKLNQPILFLTFILLLTAYSLQLNATIRYVSHSGSNEFPYTSWATASDSIMTAVNVSFFGDTIYVANGVYEEQVVMIPGLSLIGAGMDSCVIYLSATGIPAVQIKDTCLLKGFKILLPNTLNTWAIKADTSGVGSTVILNKVVNASLGINVRFSNPLVYNNVFENIKTIGIWLLNSNSVTRRNIIYTDPNSNSGSITGIDIEAFSSNYTPIIDSNYVVTKGDAIYKFLGANPTIKNNVIKLTNGGYGILSGIGGTSEIFNNRIVAEEAYEGIYKNGSIVVVTNNYLSGSFGDYGIFLGANDIIKNNVVTDATRGIGVWDIQGLIAQFNNSWNNGLNYGGFNPDSTNLSVDPMVVNDDSTQGDLDFHLQKYSPLIDAGDPNILDKDSTRSDIGLYGGPYGESYIYVDLPPRPPVNLTANVDSNIVTLKWNKNTEADFSYYNLFYDTTKNFQPDSTNLITSQTDTFYYFVIPTGVESLYFKLTAVDNQSNESNPSEELEIIITSINDYPMTINDCLLYQNYPNPFNPSTRMSLAAEFISTKYLLRVKIISLYFQI